MGRSLALALGHAGLAVALREGATPPSTAADVRAYALNASSVALLSELKVWDAIKAPSITAVHEMRVRGDAAGSMLEFSAWQQHVGALAWIVDAQALDQELDAALRFAPNVTRVDADVSAILTALCEGKGSATRSAVGVEFERSDYAQMAVAAGSRAHSTTRTWRINGSARPMFWRSCRWIHPSRTMLSPWSGRARLGVPRNSSKCKPKPLRPNSCRPAPARRVS